MFRMITLNTSFIPYTCKNNYLYCFNINKIYFHHNLGMIYIDIV